MTTKSASAEWVMLAPWLLAFAYVALVWSQLPDVIISHRDLSGHVDGWMPKQTVLLSLTGISLLLYLLLRFLPRIDPKGRLQSPLFLRIRFIVSLLLAFSMGWVFYTAANPVRIHASETVMLVIVSLAVAGMGNYLTTVKPNWFVGFRTPWTLKNDRVWTRTHRLGGRLMVAGGLVAALLAVIIPAPYTIGAVLVALLTAAIVPVVYSYIYFQQEKASQQPA